MIRLSFIVPFYNVEQYIEQCIRSLYNQDIPQLEYEVICVDDCSPDGSRVIVERLQQEFPTLRLVINKENRKLGGARNAGLDVARGEYIWFVDSDDYIAPNCLKRIISEMEANDLEVLHFESCSFDTKKIYKPQYMYDDDTIYDGITFALDQSHDSWSSRCPVAWQRVQRKDFLDEHNLRFVERMMYEDTDYSLYMFTLIKRIKHINLIAYYYRLNPKSITHVKNTGQIMFYKIMQQNRCVRAFKASQNEEFKGLIYKYIHSELTMFRKEIKLLPKAERSAYRHLIMAQNIWGLKMFCNWRTWLAVKYGIIRFVN